MMQAPKPILRIGQRFRILKCGYDCMKEGPLPHEAQVGYVDEIYWNSPTNIEAVVVSIPPVLGSRSVKHESCTAEEIIRLPGELALIEKLEDLLEHAAGEFPKPDRYHQ